MCYVSNGSFGASSPGYFAGGAVREANNGFQKTRDTLLTKQTPVGRQDLLARQSTNAYGQNQQAVIASQSGYGYGYAPQAPAAMGCASPAPYAQGCASPMMAPGFGPCQDSCMFDEDCFDDFDDCDDDFSNPCAQLCGSQCEETSFNPFMAMGQSHGFAGKAFTAAGPGGFVAQKQFAAF